MDILTSLASSRCLAFRTARGFRVDGPRAASAVTPHGLAALILLALCACSAPSLHQDIQYGSYSALRKHLDEGLSTAERNASGMTPLHAALASGKPRMALDLVRHGADINARTPTGLTPLTLAIRGGHREVVDLLLERNAAVDGQSTGPSPLIEAIVANNHDVFNRLIRAGATIDRRDHDARTALHYAADYGRLPMAERLLALGADINAVLPDNRTPLHLALSDTGALKYRLARNPALADLLYERGAVITVATGELGNYSTALVYRFAARREYVKGDASKAAAFLQEARSALLASQASLGAQADVHARKATITTLSNVALLLLGQASANLQARTSLSGTGSQTVFLGSSASSEELRDGYRNVANWCGQEAERLAAIHECVTSDPRGDRPCFSEPSN